MDFLTNLMRDFRYGFRALLKTPGTSLVAILALALGIGVNASSFVLQNALVLNPLAYPNQERIVTLWGTLPKVQTQRNPVAPGNFLDWKEQSKSFEQMAAFRPMDMNMTGTSDPERIQACQVTPDFFPLMGLRPLVGRVFLEEEAEVSRSRVAVVSQDFWKTRLAASPGVMGKSIFLDGRSYTVVGVMPTDFDFPLGTQLWVPLSFAQEEKSQRTSHNLLVLGRRKVEVSFVQVREEMGRIARRLEEQFPQANEARGILVLPLRDLINNGTDRFVMILMSAAFFVLLLACTNVANLQLARATSRKKDIAVKAALGASRVAIARQLLAESILMGLLGGVVGLLLASWNLEITRGAIPPQVLKWVAGIKKIRIDSFMLLFTLASSLFAGILCAIPSTLSLVRRKAAQNLNEVLKEGGRGSGSGPVHNRLRYGLVIVEVALALVLLIGAGLMVRTFQRMLQLNLGYNPENLLSLQIALPSSKYPEDSQVIGFYDRLLQGLEILPEVKAAGTTGYLGTVDGLRVEGRPEPRPGEPLPNLRNVSSRYFETMGIPIKQGRFLSAQDGPDSLRVVVVSEAVARHYWPASEPVGQRIQLGNAQSPWLTVVGICGDVKNWFTGEPIPEAYIPSMQIPRPTMQILVRTASNPLHITAGVRATVKAIDPSQPVYDLKSWDQIIAEQTSGVRFSSNTMLGYAVIALLLATTGIYAVISYFVIQRTHEIGIRIALGASSKEVLKMVVGQAMTVAGVGLLIGLPLAFGLGRLMSNLLDNVVAVDWITLMGLTMALISAALLAGFVPAYRATKVDPMIALRHE